MLSRLAGHRARVASTMSVALVAVGLSTAAVLSPGTPQADVDLHDRSVLVVRSSQGAVGRLNLEAAQIGSHLTSSARDIDVVQDGRSAVQVERGRSLSVIDPVLVSLGEDVPIPEGAQVMVGATTVAILDPSTGALWAADIASVGDLDATKQQPVEVLGSGGKAAVAASGLVYALAPDSSELVTVEARGSSGVVTARESLLGLSRSGTDLQVSAAGEHPVILDVSSGRLTIPGLRTVQLSISADARLQQRSDSRTIGVADRGQLIAVRLDGDPVVRSVSVEGEAQPPVTFGDCVYGAWTVATPLTATVAGWCGSAAPDVTPVPNVPSGADLQLRAAADTAVLNDRVSGTSWLLTDDLRVVDRWPLSEEETSTPDDSTVEVDPAELLRERPVDNTPPMARDDKLGARPGRTSVLPVLLNDMDPDGDVLSVHVGELSGDLKGRVTVIGDGSALKISLPTEASGTYTVPYVISDGRPLGTDRGVATVTVRPLDLNEPPVQELPRSTSVSVGASATTNVLDGWRDPDGDELFLRGVAASTGSTRWTGDGQVVYTPGARAGRADLTLDVSDGSATGTGHIPVTVVSSGDVPPVTQADQVTVVRGTTARVAPLANDHAPSGRPLTLHNVGNTARVRGVSDSTQTGFTVRLVDDETLEVGHTTTGVYYVGYQASDGRGTPTPGLVRIDVVDPVPGNGPPVTSPDRALLTAGQTTLVDPTANDTDPDGDVLVVSEVKVPPRSGLTVAVVQHQLLRIEGQGRLREPVIVPYVVSDGSHSVTEQLTVLPVPARTDAEPPLARPDTIRVREGNVATIRPLDNDSGTPGSPLELLSALPKPLDPTAGQGLLFVSGDLVRYQAQKPGRYVAAYAIRDALDQEVEGRIDIEVVPADSPNNKPYAPTITARAIAGSTIVIPLPPELTDPEGDSVQLTGLVSAPQHGLARAESNVIIYTVPETTSGTDTFRYEVTDSRGAASVGTVQVGVAGRPNLNRPPVAMNDTVTVRPNRALLVDVLVNDADPDGDPLTVAEATALTGAEATVTDNRVSVTSASGTASREVSYRLSDGRGGSDAGVLVVQSDPEAPLYAPIARDDVVSREEVSGRTEVEVDFLANDGDPDGTRLSAEIPAFASTEASIRGSVMVVPVTDTDQVVPYAVRDSDGLVSYAFVVVPGVKSLGPVLAPMEPQTVKAGTERTWRLSDIVTTEDGRIARLAEGARLSISPASGHFTLVARGDDAFTLRVHEDHPADSVAVYFTVDDRIASDRTRTPSVLVLPVAIVPKDNVPPEIRSMPSYEVEDGGVSPVIDLSQLVTDPDKEDRGRLTFTSPRGPAGFRVEALGEARYRVSAEPGAHTRGLPQTFSYTVSDPAHVDTPVTGRFTLTVVDTTAPPPQVQPDVATQHQGETATYDVTKNDYNPFAGQGRPLSVVNFDVEPASQAGRVMLADNRIQVAAGTDYTGDIVVTYRVEDATHSPIRQDEGSLRIRVIGLPEAPRAVRVVSVGDEQVSLAIEPGSDRGARIEYFEVTEAGVSQRCSSSCTITGLDNGRPYSFSVIAHNEVGDSPPTQSNPATPDVLPLAPKVSVRPGDERIDVLLQPGQGDRGSQIVEWHFDLYHPEGLQQAQGWNRPDFAAIELTNGVRYTYDAWVTNAKGDSPHVKGVVITEGVAPPMPAPVCEVRETEDGELVADVSWSAPKSLVASGGDTVDGYRVFQGSSSSRNGPWLTTGPSSLVTETGWTSPSLVPGRMYRWGVQLVNSPYDNGPRASEVTAWCDPVQAAGTPGAWAEGALSASTPDAGTVTVRSGDMPSSGSTGITYLRITMGSRTWDTRRIEDVRETNARVYSTSFSVELPTDEVDPVTVSVEACNSAEKCSKPGLTNEVTPWRAPLPPDVHLNAVKGDVLTSIVASYGPFGRPPTKVTYEVYVNGSRTNAGEQALGNQDSYSFGVRPYPDGSPAGFPARVRVRARLHLDVDGRDEYSEWTDVEMSSDMPSYPITAGGACFFAREVPSYDAASDSTQCATNQGTTLAEGAMVDPVCRSKASGKTWLRIGNPPAETHVWTLMSEVSIPAAAADKVPWCDKPIPGPATASRGYDELRSVAGSAAMILSVLTKGWSS